MPTRTVAQGWIPTATGNPIPGQCYEVLCAGGKTLLALHEPRSIQLPTPPTEENPEPAPHEASFEWWHLEQPNLLPGDPLAEPVYAWRFPGTTADLGWEPYPATDRPWFPMPSADRLRPGVIVEVLCHDGKTGLAWRQLGMPTEAAPEGELVWEWCDEAEGPEILEPAFWRFHLDSRLGAQETSNLTLQLHPTLRKHNLFLSELLRPPVQFLIPAPAPGFTPCPQVPSFLEGTSPEVELVEIWAAMNDLATWAMDPARNVGQLYFLENRLGNLFRPMAGVIGDAIARAMGEGR